MNAVPPTVEVSQLSEVETALSEGLDVKSIVAQILTLSGHKYRPITEFRDILEIWTPERAFATYVLAQALKDIEPLAAEVPDNILGSPKRLTSWFEHEKRQRTKRIVVQQFREQEFRHQELELGRNYRHDLRICYAGIKAKRVRKFQLIRQEPQFRRLQNRYRKLYSTLNTRKESDTIGAAIRWFENERAAVRMWCDLACVDLLRCYIGVQRRLALIGRCSIPIQKIIKQLRSQPVHAKSKEGRIANLENKVWTPFELSAKRRNRAIDLIRQLPRDEQDIPSSADREFLHRLHETVVAAGNISPKHLSRLQGIVDRYVRKD